MLYLHRAPKSGADVVVQDEPAASVPLPGQHWTTEFAESFILLHAPAVAGAMFEPDRALRFDYPDGKIVVYRYTAWTLVRYLSPPE